MDTKNYNDLNVQWFRHTILNLDLVHLYMDIFNTFFGLLLIKKNPHTNCRLSGDVTRTPDKEVVMKPLSIRTYWTLRNLKKSENGTLPEMDQQCEGG